MGSFPTLEIVYPLGSFDGAVRVEEFGCGAGAIIKLDHFKSYSIWWNCGQGTNSWAKLLALWTLLWKNQRFHIDHLHIHGDSKIVVDWLANRGNLQVISLEYWKSKIKNLLSSFSQVQICHVKRDDNLEANTLSKNATIVEKGKMSIAFMSHGAKFFKHSLSLF